MSPYEERLQRDLEGIRETVALLGDAVGKALESSLRALLTGDRQLAYLTILRDQAVNRRVLELNRKCHAFVARHLPSAGHLRYISSVLQLNIALERIGDYAVSIGRESAQLSAPPPEPFRGDLDLFARRAGQTFDQALKAFLTVDPELGRSTKEMASPLSRTYDQMFESLLREGERRMRPLRDLFGLLNVLGRLGRVVDQAKNICEESIFAATGQVKPPKTFRIIFVDRDEGLRATIAAAVARKGYGNGIEYSVAARDAESPLPENLVAFLDRHGHSPWEPKRRAWDSLAESLRDFHIAINVGLAKTDLPPMPYHTVLLDWTDVESGRDAGAATDADLQGLYHELGDKLDRLIEILRGTA
jgi:phosphate transport system protein